MSDAVTAARSARESLARGLNALQSTPNVPPQLLDLAEPIAQAMGALHQIEKSGGTALVPHADSALSLVRTALGQLQAQPSQHPAVMGAMEAVAGSLGLVHQLSNMAKAAPAQPYAQTQAQPAFPQASQFDAAPQPGFQQPQPPTAFQRPSQDAFGPPPPVVQQQAPYQQPPQAPYAQQAPFPQQTSQQPMRQNDPFAQPPLVQGQRFPAAPAYQGGGGAVPTGEIVNADLGAHSPSNFYKGLSGNDIIDHGGLFVSTYKIPKLGTAVRLKVSLPGGYEFEANAVVRWSREASDGSGSDAPPGFGAQFTEITPEARQLVYRYVRNREPLFHDDL